MQKTGGPRVRWQGLCSLACPLSFSSSRSSAPAAAGPTIPRGDSEPSASRAEAAASSCSKRGREEAQEGAPSERELERACAAIGRDLLMISCQLKCAQNAMSHFMGIPAIILSRFRQLPGRCSPFMISRGSTSTTSGWLLPIGARAQFEPYRGAGALRLIHPLVLSSERSCEWSGGDRIDHEARVLVSDSADSVCSLIRKKAELGENADRRQTDS